MTGEFNSRVLVFDKELNFIGSIDLIDNYYDESCAVTGRILKLGGNRILLEDPLTNYSILDLTEFKYTKTPNIDFSFTYDHIRSYGHKRSYIGYENYEWIIRETHRKLEETGIYQFKITKHNVITKGVEQINHDVILPRIPVIDDPSFQIELRVFRGNHYSNGWVGEIVYIENFTDAQSYLLKFNMKDQSLTSIHLNNTRVGTLLKISDTGRYAVFPDHGSFPSFSKGIMIFDFKNNTTRKFEGTLDRIDQSFDLQNHIFWMRTSRGVRNFNLDTNESSVLGPFTPSLYNYGPIYVLDEYILSTEIKSTGFPTTSDLTDTSKTNSSTYFPHFVTLCVLVKTQQLSRKRSKNPK